MSSPGVSVVNVSEGTTIDNVPVKADERSYSYGREQDVGVEDAQKIYRAAMKNRYGVTPVAIDGEVAAGFESFDVAITNIEASDEEAVEGLRDAVDATLQCRRDQMRTVQERGALGMITGHRELESFTGLRYAVTHTSVPAQENVRLHSISRMTVDQLRQRRSPVADDGREVLVGNRENLATTLVRKAVVEDSCLVWTSVVWLQQHRI